MTPEFTLPHWLQYSVALATILSSFAVIFYIIQLFVTRSQFRRQISLNESQLEISSNQFKLLNQGYLILNVNMELVNPELAPGTVYNPDLSFQGINFIAILSNGGNTPLVFKLINFQILFRGRVQGNIDQGLIQNPVYPKEGVTLPLSGVSFDVNNRLFSLQEIIDLNITFKLVIEYHDFNDTKNKKIEREARMHYDGYKIFGQHTLINDSI